MPTDRGDGLAGRRAPVTGGTQGAGAAIADRLRAAGVDALAVARHLPVGYPTPDRFIAADISSSTSEYVIDGGTIPTV